MDEEKYDSIQETFGLMTDFTDRDLELLKIKTKNEKINEKYRTPLPCQGKKFLVEDYIDFSVKGYNKKQVKIKTYCNYNSDVAPKSVLFLIHGFASHSSKSSHVAEYLANDGIMVCAMDLREHGKSDEDLTYFRSLLNF